MAQSRGWPKTGYLPLCKKRKYCNRMREKKSLLLMNVHVLYVLEDKTSKKNFRPSVCLFVCLSVCLFVCPSVLLVYYVVENISKIFYSVGQYFYRLNTVIITFG